MAPWHFPAHRLPDVANVQFARMSGALMSLRCVPRWRQPLAGRSSTAHRKYSVSSGGLCWPFFGAVALQVNPAHCRRRWNRRWLEEISLDSMHFVHVASW